MLLTLSLTGPFFAVVALGFFAARKGWMPDGAVRSLNVFVFYFAMPALIIRALGRQDISSAFDGPAIIVWGLAGFLAFALAMAVMRVAFAAPLAEMALAGQAASVGNIGFLALPLMLAAFGDIAAPPIAIALIIDLTVLIPLSIGLLEWSSGKSGGTTRMLAGVARGVLVNPFILAMAAGGALSLSGLTLAAPVDRFFVFLGNAAGATALFSLGVSLAERHVGGDGRAIAILVALKLLVHPALIYALAQFFGLDALQTGLFMVIAAMPIAGNVFVIAEQYGVLVQRLSTAILLSTALGVVTVSFAVMAAKG
ncbi:AEC family transporter [Stappia stellulata]|uniref:AEC family transporter n=1 Tax=Stappia stellulata TaxID=71235 RepID=UPI0004266B45|nr:AEC family transporter [Stappia stellulata]